jgi:hypothetical protein
LDANLYRFPPPKIFTNSLLSNHDITSLIRDTETHERALFSVPPPPPPATSQNPDPPKQSSRRQTVFNVASGEVTTSGPSAARSAGAPRRHTAVAAVLGGDLNDEIRRSERGRNKDNVDVETLLKGAERLCSVYPLPGALERIPIQRAKYVQHLNTLAYYEARVAEQAETLGRMNKDIWMDEDEAEEGGDHEDEESEVLTENDLKREEEEVRELDKKKRELQDRLRAIEKDIGGLRDL